MIRTLTLLPRRLYVLLEWDHGPGCSIYLRPLGFAAVSYDTRATPPEVEDPPNMRSRTWRRWGASVLVGRFLPGVDP